jgi:hypothetical protein
LQRVAIHSRSEQHHARADFDSAFQKILQKHELSENFSHPMAGTQVLLNLFPPLKRRAYFHMACGLEYFRKRTLRLVQNVGEAP